MFRINVALRDSKVDDLWIEDGATDMDLTSATKLPVMHNATPIMDTTLAKTKGWAWLSEVT